MALQFHSIYQTVGDGVNTTFTVPFPYLEKEHVHVFVNGTEVYAYFPFGQDAQVKVEPAPAADAEVLIRRVTPIDEQLVVFQNRSTLNDRSLNRATQQVLYAQQELKDAIFSGVYGLNLDGLEGLEGSAGSVVDEITQRVTETALYAELQSRIEDIDSLSESLIKHSTLLDSLSSSTTALEADAESLAESAIEGYLRENSLLETTRLMEHKVGQNEARIEEEAVTRATEDSALAGRIDTVEALTADNEARITTEEVTRSDADSALSARIDTVESTVNDNAASIQDEAATRATEDEALAQQINTVFAQSANIFRQPTAPDPAQVTINENDLWIDTGNGNRAKAWDGTQWVDAQDTDIAAAFSAIESEQTARADADSALASDITTLQSQTNDNAAAIQSEATTRADADTALGSRIDTVETSAADNAAAIQTEQTARADADSALASDITTLQSEVDGNTATIQTQATTIDGLQAQYTVKIDINGKVVGYGLASDGTGDTANGSSFTINADNFSVVDPDTGEVSIGWDGTSSSFLVNGDLITNGSIQSDKLNISQLSEVSNALGIITAGTFKTSSSSTGYRVEMSDSGSYPLWYGTGSKTAANAKFYMDASGNAMFRGDLDVKSADTGARLEMRNNVIKVYDENGALRVRIGDLTA